jgi:nitrogenase-stabilizing/protective protein
MSDVDGLESRLAAFDSASTAEEYFDVLEIPVDAAVVNVNRLHILKMFSADVERIRADADAEPDAATLLVEYRQSLEQAYRTFTESGALDHRLFKVLRDHAPDADLPTVKSSTAFVSLADIRIGPGR